MTPRACLATLLDARYLAWSAAAAALGLVALRPRQRDHPESGLRAPDRAGAVRDRRVAALWRS